MTAAEPNRRDALEILSFFHFAVGALFVMIALVPFALHLVGSAMSDPAAEAGVRAEGERVAGAFSTGCVTLALAAGLVGGVIAVWTGRNLARKSGFRACLVGAGLECLFVPAGTILGAVTISTLLRPEIRSLFADGRA
jgi:hypothetical protein